MTRVELEETTLPAPHFDEAAEQSARPVVPLSEEVLAANPGAPTNYGSRLTALRQGKGSWLLAAVAGLILAAGALAIGVTAYRRNPVISTQALVPVADATRVEMKQEFKPNRSSVSSAPAAPQVKTSRRVITRQVFPERPSDTSSGRPKARMVDSYVMRGSRP
jgi:hypothetical protein